MTISTITVWRENLDLTRPYTIAYKTVSSVENAFVCIELADGTRGIGACNPSKPVVGESLDEAFALLSAPETTSWLRGQDIRQMQRLCAEVQHRFPKSPATRAALDIALHDAFAQFLGVPLVEYLGRAIDALPTSITIGIKGVEETLKEAEEYIQRGFRVLKVKTGASLEEDVARLTELRRCYATLTPSLVIRIDSNQGYSAAQAQELYERLRGLDIELNEQPIPAHDVAAMRSLPEEIRRTIAADEALISPRDALNLALPPRACGIFNIKLMKCGGITPARRIAALAETAGIELMWGCNDESIVSIAAALHVAFSSPATKYIDLDGSLDLARDAVRGGFHLEHGIMRTTAAHGLGVELLSR
jgi:L-alanine-DL-glutamate epimerase-like enolase superfamily enzyme